MTYAGWWFHVWMGVVSMVLMFGPAIAARDGLVLTDVLKAMATATVIAVWGGVAL